MPANEKKLSRAFFSNATCYSLPVFGFGWKCGERILADRINHPTVFSPKAAKSK
jgi:hypothetical protein